MIVIGLRRELRRISHMESPTLLSYLEELELLLKIQGSIITHCKVDCMLVYRLPC